MVLNIFFIFHFQIGIYRNLEYLSSSIHHSALLPNDPHQVHQRVPELLSIPQQTEHGILLSLECVIKFLGLVLAAGDCRNYLERNSQGDLTEILWRWMRWGEESLVRSSRCNARVVTTLRFTPSKSPKSLRAPGIGE